MDLVKEQMWNRDVFTNHMTALLEDIRNDISSVSLNSSTLIHNISKTNRRLQHKSRHLYSQQSILRFLILNTDTPSPSCINRCIKTTHKSDLKANILIKMIHCHCLN